ncbi:MAG: cupin domain-containing protein [Clostridiales bacterium]|jgi:transcriptional regulator with XRE-family HTH domain|nr:cupin domain-containing protein [Clostridiales bacterium]
MTDQMLQVSLRIRDLREISGYSENEVAGFLGVSEERYKEYEKNGEDIPISAIYKLASIYKTDTTDILLGKSPKLNTFSLVKRGEGIHVERFSGYEYENIAFRFTHRTMEPMIVTLKPGGERPAMVTHSGQELNYCLAGKVIVIYDDVEIELSPGDCAYFDPTHPHGQMAGNGGDAKFLTVINE